MILQVACNLDSYIFYFILISSAFTKAYKNGKENLENLNWKVWISQKYFMKKEVIFVDKKQQQRKRVRSQAGLPDESQTVI